MARKKSKRKTKKRMRGGTNTPLRFAPTRRPDKLDIIINQLRTSRLDGINVTIP